MKKTPLTAGWTVRPEGSAENTTARFPLAATVPGCIHTDLLAAGHIPDPFDGTNERDLQWIGLTDWVYEVEFDWESCTETRHDLVCDGLDTVVMVELNGVEIGAARNQHRSYRFDMRPGLKAGRNRLTLHFSAPVPYAREQAEILGDRPHSNHHPFNAMRKMASNFGWDWGPDLATVGIWRNISIESWSTARIASARTLTSVRGSSGILAIHVEVEYAEHATTEASGLSLSAEIDGHSTVLELAAGETRAELTIELDEVDLWWPRGYGSQPLYTANVELNGTASMGEPARLLDSHSARCGFRTVHVDIAPDDIGSPFTIIVNGVRINIRGANWIPDDAFIAQVDRARYGRRIDDATDANMNLLRVWGGGIYESSDFYDLCDERGVLVWQDFLFACAAYSEDESLWVEVEAEAREAITRLSQHASLVVWNGNNENIWGYVDWGWRSRLSGEAWGEKYYRELLPALVSELDPDRFYSPGSPYSFSDYLHPNDPHYGTMHMWDVWNRLDYSHFTDHAPRFVSEFGFQGPPAWSTLMEVVHDSDERPTGEQLLNHQKAADGMTKLARGLGDHIPMPTDTETWHWAMQLNQAHAITFAMEYFRALEPSNSGMIVWQLNDNWPVVSWAAVDYREIRKPVWYAIRAAYEPVLVTVQRNGEQMVVHLSNDTSEPIDAQLLIRRIDFRGGLIEATQVSTRVEPHASGAIDIDHDVATSLDPDFEVLVIDLTGSATGRAIYNYGEILTQRLERDNLDVHVEHRGDAIAVTATARSYVRDVVMMVDKVSPLLRVDSGMITLLPGESHTFMVSGAEVDPGALLQPGVMRTGNELCTVREANA